MPLFAFQSRLYSTPLTQRGQAVIYDLNMTNAPDAADELRIDDRFFSHVTVDRWAKPHSVVLRCPSKKRLSDIVKDGPLYPEYSRLLIELADKNLTNARPPATLLQSFMGLSRATDDRIRDFCSWYGGLSVFCEVEQVESSESLRVTEFCEVWRYLASSMKALLRIAAKLNRGSAGAREDWDRIGEVPPMIKAAQSKERWDWLSPAPLQGEGAWAIMSYFVRKSDRNRNRQMWTRLVNTLLDLGRVRPLVLWDSGRPGPRPYLAYGTPSLFSYLALQVSLLSVGRRAFALCSYCNQEYVPTRKAPKPGQRNFCSECRANGVPARLAQRDRRARLRALESSD